MPVFEVFTDEPVPEDGVYLFPVAPDTFEQTVLKTDFVDAEVLNRINSLNGHSPAYLLSLKKGASPIVQHQFTEGGPGLPDNAFIPGDTGFDVASDELAKQVAAAISEGTPAERTAALMQFIADHFTYGMRETYLGVGEAAMSPLGSGITIGTCVDIHTLGVAALRSMGVNATYVVGCQIADGKTDYFTGHCWLNTKADGVPHHYDISHHVQYGVNPVTPALNPHPGRRFALNFGRGPIFAGPEGQIQLPSLSGFHMATGERKGERLRTFGRFID